MNGWERAFRSVGRLGLANNALFLNQVLRIYGFRDLDFSSFNLKCNLMTLEDMVFLMDV